MRAIQRVKGLMRRIGLALGILKPVPYVRDLCLPNVINRICCAPVTDGAYLVAVETRQGMVQLMSYMKKNGVSACVISNDTLDGFHRLNLRGALACMEVAPYKYQVYVILKYYATSGWRFPREFLEAWGRVNLLTSFMPEADWRAQFKSKLRECA